MERRRLLFLTNFEHGWREEDDFLIREANVHFGRLGVELTACHPSEVHDVGDEISGVIIRNVWPTHEYLVVWHDLLARLRHTGVRTYNSLDGKGDITGKRYLLELFRAGFPVIPSHDQAADCLKDWPEVENFWIKPEFGCDGSGTRQVTKDHLETALRPGEIVQPLVGFVSEPSFYFLDGKFLYAVSTPNRIDGSDVAFYSPPPDEIRLAREFVDWNGLGHGIERVDFLRCADGRMLLTEIEDIAEYLYLMDLPPDARRSVCDALLSSIEHHLLSPP